MVKCLFVVALVALVFSSAESRSLLQAAVPVPAPSTGAAQAPTASVNGEPAYLCRSPGISGYLYQVGLCRFGTYAGSRIFCDQSTEGTGIVSIREMSSGPCGSSSDCGDGQFCNTQISVNGTCTPVADPQCFAGVAAPPMPPRGRAPAPAPALAPVPVPAPAVDPVASAVAPVPDPIAPVATDPALSTLQTTLSPMASAPAPLAASGDGAGSSQDLGASASGVAAPTAGS